MSNEMTDKKLDFFKGFFKGFLLGGGVDFLFLRTKKLNLS